LKGLTHLSKSFNFISVILSNDIQDFFATIKKASSIMKKPLAQTASVFAFLLSVVMIQSCNSSKQASPEAIVRFNSLIPKPASALTDGKSFLVSENTQIVFEGSGEVQQIATFLSSQLKPATGFDFPVIEYSKPVAAKSILLTTAGADMTLGDEGYELVVSPESVKLSAKTPAGLFMGVQSLRQLLPEKIESASPQESPWEIASGTIRDSPVYAWRGTMLDVARHFLSVDDVKRYIDLISLYKMNILHLHLSDDQGWRIEIKSWPNLTLIGGSTQVGGGPGGYYTQEQYKELVGYAKARYVTIVPEIDMPGHTNAALASYGELNSGIIVPKEGSVPISTQGDLGKEKPTELYSGTVVGFSTLSLKKPSTFKFVEDVVRELAAITPGPYIHLGGDEASVTKKEDYIEFVNRFQKIAEANGKIMVGWEEIAQGDINDRTIAQFWKSKEHAEMAASKGAKIVMSPSTNVYLDMKYDTASRIGYNWAAYIEVDSAYKWKPEIKVAGVPRENIIGVEAPLWSETIKNFDDVEYLSFPRIPGVAEIGWTPSEKRNWDEYKSRLGNHAKRFKALGIDYYPSKLVSWVN
jgi:hexosaminidase